MLKGGYTKGKAPQIEHQTSVGSREERHTPQASPRKRPEFTEKFARRMKEQEKPRQHQGFCPGPTDRVKSVPTKDRTLFLTLNFISFKKVCVCACVSVCGQDVCELREVRTAL